jgi:hypothetical protein
VSAEHQGRLGVANQSHGPAAAILTASRTGTGLPAPADLHGGNTTLQRPITWPSSRFRKGDASSREFHGLTGRDGLTALNSPPNNDRSANRSLPASPARPLSSGFSLFPRAA